MVEQVFEHVKQGTMMPDRCKHDKLKLTVDRNGNQVLRCEKYGIDCWTEFREVKPS